ncbi:MAG: response regulator transcription factor [Chloroflexi bacterium]|nr:response regulator transcription factor [Chloroflexota bacterium]
MIASTPQRVLIIDRHPAVGRGLKALVGNMPGLRVVGLATRGENGLAQAAEATPDVALVDADLPGLCSEAVIRLLRSRLPLTRIVALGIYPERKWTLLTAGAHEFVLKDAGYDALRSAIAGPAAGPASDAPDAATDTTSAAVAGPVGPGRPTRNAERVLP